MQEKEKDEQELEFYDNSANISDQVRKDYL